MDSSVNNQDEGVLSPEIKGIVAQLEAEIANAEIEFQSQLDGNHPKQNILENNDESLSSLSSEEDSIFAATAIQKQMAAEEIQMQCFVEEKLALRRQPKHLSPPPLTPRPSDKDLAISSDNRMKNSTLSTSIAKTTARSTPIHKSSPRVESKWKLSIEEEQPYILHKPATFISPKIESLSSSITNDINIANGSTHAHAIEEGKSFHTINLDPSQRLSKYDPEQGVIREEILPDGNQDHSYSTKGATSMGSNCVRRSVKRLRTCFSSICTCISNVFMAIWVALSLLVNSVNNYFKECTNNQLEMISLAPKAMKTITSWTTDMERGIGLPLTCVAVSMITTIYPTAPGYNIFIAIILLFVQIKPVEWLNKNFYHSILLIVTVMISICLDTDWLYSKYFPTSLVDEDELAYQIEQETSVVYAIAWYTILLNIFLKLICLNEALKCNVHGMNIHEQVWKTFFGKCLITINPKDLGAAVKDKIIALVWLEAVCCLACFGCFFVIEFGIVSSSLFWNVPNQVISLQGSLLIKGTSGCLVFLSLAHHIPLLATFGCNYVCPMLAESHSGDRGNERKILTTVSQSLWCIGIAKVLDFSVGILSWIGLIYVQGNVGFDAPKQMKTFLAIIFSTLILASIICPIMASSIVWYIILSKRRNAFRRQHRRENTPSDILEHRSRRSVRNMTSHYDLSEPRQTQTMFETRLSRASTSKPSNPVQQSDDLENFTCTSSEFQAIWSSLETSLTLTQEIHSIPTLSDIHKHCNERRFHVVASGKLDDTTTRLFIIAQRAASRSSSLRNNTSRCLFEITVNSSIHRMNAEVRCRNKDDIRFFLGALGLSELDGSSTRREMVQYE